MPTICDNRNQTLHSFICLPLKFYLYVPNLFAFHAQLLIIYLLFFVFKLLNVICTKLESTYSAFSKVFYKITFTSNDIFKGEQMDNLCTKKIRKCKIREKNACLLSDLLQSTEIISCIIVCLHQVMVYFDEGPKQCVLCNV